jgi:hypothetical protein
MVLFIVVCGTVITHLLLYALLFEDFTDFKDQLKSLLAWLPVTVLTDYDFSNATWRIWVWLASGSVVAGFLLHFLGLGWRK